MSAEELGGFGQDSLREHIAAQAVVAHHRSGPLTSTSSTRCSRPECVRHPTQLVYEFGEMALHQFAQPDTDWRNTELDGRVLYLRPMLRDRPELVVLAVAYMIPLINYGPIINDEHCLGYGAALLGPLGGRRSTTPSAGSRTSWVRNNRRRAAAALRVARARAERTGVREKSGNARAFRDAAPVCVPRVFQRAPTLSPSATVPTISTRKLG